MKNSYVFHLEWMELFREAELTKEEIADVIAGIECYVVDGKEPVYNDRTLKAIWASIKKLIDMDAAAYEERCEKNRQNVLKRWGKDGVQTDTTVYDGIQSHTNGYDSIRADTKNTDTDSDSDTNISTLSLTDNNSINNNIYITNIENVYSYFDTKGSTRAEAEKFYEYYSQRDWKINGNPIISWQKVADRWISNIRSPDKKTKAHNFTQRNYSKADNDRLNRILFGH